MYVGLLMLYSHFVSEIVMIWIVLIGEEDIKAFL